MADNLEQTKISIESNIKMLALAERESKRLLARNKYSKLEKCKANIETRVETLQDLKYKVQEIMTEKDEEASDIDAYAEQLEERISKFEDVISSLEKAIQLLAGREEAKSKPREDQEQEVEFRRKLEQEKELEEMRMEMRKQFEKKEGKFRFWNQFETETEQQGQISPATKYSSSESYSRAKAILQAKFGKPTIVANTHSNCIISLPVVFGSHPNKVHDFYEKLMSSVQALKTMRKLNKIKGYVRNTLAKLPGIRSDLVRLDDSWQDWRFCQLVEALRKWTERNPKIIASEKTPKRDNVYLTKEREQKTRSCVYCEKEGHKLRECKTVECVSDCRLELPEKNLCFNCTGSKHKASECRNTKTCQFCSEKHHNSIWEKGSNILLTTNTSHVTYLVV